MPIAASRPHLLDDVLHNLLHAFALITMHIHCNVRPVPNTHIQAVAGAEFVSQSETTTRGFAKIDHTDTVELVSGLQPCNMNWVHQLSR